MTLTYICVFKNAFVNIIDAETKYSCAPVILKSLYSFMLSPSVYVKMCCFIKRAVAELAGLCQSPLSGREAEPQDLILPVFFFTSDKLAYGMLNSASLLSIRCIVSSCNRFCHKETVENDFELLSTPYT